MALLASLIAEGSDHSSVDVENLHSVIIRVGYNDSVCVGHGNVVGVFQLSGFVADATEFTHERAVGLENLCGEK